MTKQQPYVTSLPPSRLCRLLLLIFAIKLTVLGVMIFEPAMPEEFSSHPVIATIFGSSKGRSAAQAASAQSVGAPPAMEATLPDGSPALVEPKVEEEGIVRALPSIGNSRRPSLAATNATTAVEASPMSLDILSRRQEELERKEQDLRVLEGEIAGKIEKLQILENRLGTMIKEADETNDAKFRHLVDVLSNMKSKQAAAVLETLDHKIAVRALAGMRGRQAGEILTFVKPEIAALLTESLARMQLPLD